MADSVLLKSRPFSCNGVSADAVRWNVTNQSGGLCAPTVSPNGTFGSLDECQRTSGTCSREIRWNLVNSQGYGPQGQIVAECRPSLDPYSSFRTAQECVSSARGGTSAYPKPERPRVWICTNPVLRECIDMELPAGSISYKTYDTYEACKNDPMNNLDSGVMMGGLAPYYQDNTSMNWYIDADRNRCAPSTLLSAPFQTMQQCETALQQCNSSGQPTLQFSNPLQATDSHWKEPYLGYRSQTGRVVLPYMQTPQIALNPVDRVPIISTLQIAPGLAGQGFSTV
jgi:hypothetical protein